MSRKLVGWSSIILGIVLLVTGSGSSHSSAPDPGGRVGSNGTVLQMPDGFRNVAFSCFGHNGVYVTSRSLTDSLPLDEHCP